MIWGKRRREDEKEVLRVIKEATLELGHEWHFMTDLGALSYIRSKRFYTALGRLHRAGKLESKRVSGRLMFRLVPSQ